MERTPNKFRYLFIFLYNSIKKNSQTGEKTNKMILDIAKRKRTCGYCSREIKKGEKCINHFATKSMCVECFLSGVSEVLAHLYGKSKEETELALAALMI